MRSLLRRTVYTLISLAFGGMLLIGAGTALIAYLHSDQCERLVESLPSPDKSWVVERYLSGCAEAAWETFALRRRSEAPGKAQHIFLETKSEISPGVRWLNDKHLLVATEAGKSYLLKTISSRWIDISYASYSHDPSLPRDPATVVVSHHMSLFDSRFVRDEGYGLPGIGCNLYLSTEANSGSDRVYIRLSADRVFAIKNRTNLALSVPERRGFALLFAYSTDYNKPLPFVTSVAINGLIAPSSQATANFIRSFQPSLAPAGSLVPSWQTQWNLSEQQFAEILQSIQEVRFTIAVDYWLTDVEETYTSLQVRDMSSIENFAECVKHNTIYDSGK